MKTMLDFTQLKTQSLRLYN